MPEPNNQPHPEATQTEHYWWCERCYSQKSPVQVTYQETCTRCGQPVEWRCDEAAEGNKPMTQADQPTAAQHCPSCERLRAECARLDRLSDMQSKAIEMAFGCFDRLGIQYGEDENTASFCTALDQLEHSFVLHLRQQVDSLRAECDSLRAKLAEVDEQLIQCHSARLDQSQVLANLREAKEAADENIRRLTKGLCELQAMLVSCRNLLEKTHYTCERCGGYGKQEAGSYNADRKAYDEPAGLCTLCGGGGYLGVRT